MNLLKKVTKLSKKQTYLLACSYGPDSMALFYYLLENGYSFEVAHVNYHILEQADDDERGIKEFCDKYSITLHVLSTNMPENVNEEIWARDVRYYFFEEVCEKTKIKNVLVAHNEGDDVETYLLQKERGAVFFHYGLEKISKRGNIKIVRPLLKIKKSELEKYCKENNIPYSIDPSNFDSKFKRNKIRKELSQLDDSQIRNILIEKKIKNLQNLDILSKFEDLGIPKYINTNSKLFDSITIKEFHLLLIYLLKYKNVFTPISEGRCKNLMEIIKNKAGNHKEKINSAYFLYLDYGVIQILKKGKPYVYEFDNPDSKNEIFHINKKAKEFKLLKEAFPITIKPAKEGKTYEHKGFTLKVNREFISWKMPAYLRDVWPGVYDKNDLLIFVPRYQTKIKKNGLIRFKCKQLLCWYAIKSLWLKKSKSNLKL